MAFALFASANTRIRVVDAENNEPLPMATVFAKSGIIIGLTDNDGYITISSANDFPITVRCLGYESKQCSENQTEIKLANQPFALQEVVVTPVDRPVARIICYVREYISSATGTDTLMSYNEHMADFFIPVRDKLKGFKGKTKPRFLRSRLYSRMTNSEGLDSIFSPQYRDDTFAWELLFEMPRKEIIETEAIQNGAVIDSIPAKHGTKGIMRKAGGNYITTTDYLADIKNHTWSPVIFKLLGLTIDFNKMQEAWVYRVNDEGRYRATDIISGTFSMSVLARGKWLKKAFKTDSPIQMYGLYEIYPVEIEYLTVDESKDLVKYPPRPDWIVSSNARPLDSSIQRIVNSFSTK